MDEMKNKKHIEENFHKMKEAYKVPPHYFEQLEQRINVKNPSKKIWYKSLIQKWSVAAMIILFMGWGLYSYIQNTKASRAINTEIVHSQQKKTEPEKSLFEDIDEEMIEEYIVDNGIIDEFYEEIDN